MSSVPELPDNTLPYVYLLASFLTSFVLVKCVSPVVSPILCPAYALLSRAKQLDWDSRVASNVHAILVCALLYYIFTYEENIYKDTTWGESLLSRVTCAIVIGYLLSDSVIIILHYNYIGSLAFLVHHAATMIPYFFVMRVGVMAYFAMFRLWAELSTPFVNQRWFLDILSFKKTSLPCLINGISMAVSFFVVRILSIPFYYWKYTSIPSIDNYDSRTRIFYTIGLYSTMALDCFNVYWMVKIFRGMYKVINSARNDSTDNNENKVKVS